MNRRTFITATDGLVVLALPLTACTSSKREATAPSGQTSSADPNAPAATSITAPGKAKKNYNLQFIQGVTGDEFYITMRCGIEAEAAKLGVTVKTQGPQKFDPTLQKPILDSVTASKPDAILIAPTDEVETRFSATVEEYDRRLAALAGALSNDEREIGRAHV